MMVTVFSHNRQVLRGSFDDVSEWVTFAETGGYVATHFEVDNGSRQELKPSVQCGHGVALQVKVRQ